MMASPWRLGLVLHAVCVVASSAGRWHGGWRGGGEASSPVQICVLEGETVECTRLSSAVSGVRALAGGVRGGVRARARAAHNEPPAPPWAPRPRRRCSGERRHALRPEPRDGDTARDASRLHGACAHACPLPARRAATRPSAPLLLRPARVWAISERRRAGVLPHVQPHARGRHARVRRVPEHAARGALRAARPAGGAHGGAAALRGGLLAVAALPHVRARPTPRAPAPLVFRARAHAPCAPSRGSLAPCGRARPPALTSDRRCAATRRSCASCGSSGTSTAGT